MDSFRLVTLSLIFLGLPTAVDAQVGQGDRPPPGWPTCDQRQVEVVILGTFHMAGHAEEIQGPRRQAEIRAVVRSLAGLEPTEIALEADIDQQETLQANYREYVEEGRDLSANERQQIGFRLARELGHDSVHAVDYPLHEIGNDSIGAFYERHPELQERYAWVLESVEGWSAEFSRRRQEGTIGEFFRWYNSEDALARESNNIMYGHVMAGEGSNYGGPRMLEKWYAEHPYRPPPLPPRRPGRRPDPPGHRRGARPGAPGPPAAHSPVLSGEPASLAAGTTLGFVSRPESCERRARP